MPSTGNLCLREISASDFTPSQQLALLSMRNCELSRRLLVKLRSSTARAGAADYRDLADLRLCAKGADGWHHLNDLGRIVAGILARKLADDFGIPIHAPPSNCGHYQRKISVSQSTW
jgi:hypothetical protein